MTGDEVGGNEAPRFSQYVCLWRNLDATRRTRTAEADAGDRLLNLGSRHRIGSLLLGYCARDDKLGYVGRVGTGISVAALERVWRRLQPLAVNLGRPAA